MVQLASVLTAFMMSPDLFLEKGTVPGQDAIFWTSCAIGMVTSLVLLFLSKKAQRQPSV